VGYYTEYELSVKDDVNEALLNDSSRVNEIRGYLSSLEEFKDAGIIPDKDHDGVNILFYTEEPIKWYEHDDFLKKLSNKFQDVVFQLNGSGEEEDDKWIKYFLNGKTQFCGATITITYPSFSLLKMK
jgi:hypothetical protein